MSSHLGICLAREDRAANKIRALVLFPTKSIWVYPTTHQLKGVLIPGVLGLFFLQTEGKQTLCYSGSVVHDFIGIDQEPAKASIRQAIFSYLRHHQYVDEYLFSLTLFCMQALEHSSAGSIEAFFLVKLLSYDGIFVFLPLCSICQKESTYRYGGEAFCSAHAPKDAIACSVEEERKIHQLLGIKDHQELATLAIPDALIVKMRMLFEVSYASMV